MKTITLLLLLSLPAVACEKGCEEYQGTCACVGTPEQAPSVQPSQDKPRKGEIPDWQSGEVRASTQTSLTYQDAKADQDRKEADEAGKKEAGVQ